MRFTVSAIAIALACSSSPAQDATALLADIKMVGSEGTGNAKAAAAWKSVVAQGVPALLPTLTAMDDANAVAGNWLRLAAQAIVEKEQQAKRPLPADAIEAFVKDTKHAPASRRLAYEFLTQADAKAPTRLLPGMIEDPSVEIRRDAIAAALESAKTADALRKLFTASRDQDQTEKIAKQLKGLKVDTDLNSHFGVVQDWMLIGPFDSTMGAGYDKAYEPETKVDLKAKYKGKDGKEVGWVAFNNAENYSPVDLNAKLGKHKDAVAYAFTVLESPKEMPVEFRLGSQTAVKVFLNGKELYAREEYHHGFRFDQYLAAGTLKTGRNELLLKLCQNNQTEGWAQDWKFQVRACDFTGGALPLKVTIK